MRTFEFGALMAISVFFSFHFERDNWRVQQVLKMGALEGQPILGSQEWEQVKRRGDNAIKEWIDNEMKYKRAVVVLVGAQTANRRWVKYEVAKAWRERKPLVGIRISGLADRNRNTDAAGPNPFAELSPMPLTVRLGGGVPLYTPRGRTSQEVYADISRNLITWVQSAKCR